MWFVKSKRAQSVDDDETWIEGGVAPTLNAFDNGDTRATVLIFEATRVEDVRIYENYSPTVATYWGTGGARVPYVYAIQGTVIGRQDENGPQGKGFGEDGEPMYTLDQVSGHAVAFQLSGDRDNPSVSVSDTAYCLPSNPMSDRGQAVAIGFSHTQGLDSQPIEEGTPTLRANGSGMAVAQAFDSYNQTLTDTNQTLRSGASDIDHTGSIFKDSQVRRLTPTECERLQGFPDGWTEGQADSHRYKQMGNAVAVPVVQWIINRL
jgi:DNA (cytosine-5)-methyltransferase 1